MFTYEINAVCDGEGLLKRVIPGCSSQMSVGIYADIAEAIHGVWPTARANGWHTATFRKRTITLCPVCWSMFLEK